MALGSLASQPVGVSVDIAAAHSKVQTEVVASPLNIPTDSPEFRGLATIPETQLRITSMPFLDLQRVFPYQWHLAPAEVFMASPTYQATLHYLCLNSGFVLLACLVGIGPLAWLIGREKQRQPLLGLSGLFFLAIGTGIMLLIAELFLLTLFHSFTRDAVLILLPLTVITSLALAFRSRAALASLLLPIQPIPVLATLFMVCAALAYQASATYGWILNDATSYHLPYADFFLLNRGLSQAPEHLIYPYHSLNLNLLYSLVLLFNRDLSFLQSFHALFSTLTFFGIYVLCAHVGRSTLAAIIAPSLYLSATLGINFHRIAAAVDGGSMYFAFIAVLCLVLWSRSRQSWLLALSAAGLGIAMGTKYLMCLFALPVALAIVLQEKKIFSRALILYIAWAAAWGLWWYLRNALLTGNPVHPFASNLFGQYLWNDQDVKLQMDALLDTRIPRTLTGYLLMPWYAGQNLVLVDQGSNLVILMIFLSTLFCRWLDRSSNILLLFCWIYLTAWFFGAQDPRYLMPVIPLAAAHLGLTLQRLLLAIRPPFLSWMLSGAAVALTTLSLVLVLKMLFIRSLDSGANLSQAIMDTNSRQNPIYDLYSHANQLFNKDDVLYEFFLRDGRWFFKGTVVGNQFGPHSYSRVIDETVHLDGRGGISAERVANLLTERYQAKGFIMPTPPYIIYDQQEFDARFTVLYRNTTGTIYGINP